MHGVNIMHGVSDICIVKGYMDRGEKHQIILRGRKLKHFNCISNAAFSSKTG